ncbi:MAG TPA: response regulator [Candidatus Limnocylindria bacterium]|nr:response regulator [Candidatus Limnocylindria bacterium]
MGARRRVIVVVEDDEPIGELIAGAINDEEGYVALRVRDAERALRALETVRVDLLIVDLGLPGMSGLELYDRIRDDPRYRGIPVVFETADHSALGEMRRRGIATYVKKPFDLDSVVRFVKSLVPPRRRGSAAA